jgi:hypothetical protein
MIINPVDWRIAYEGKSKFMVGNGKNYPEFQLYVIGIGRLPSTVVLASRIPPYKLHLSD